MIVEHGPGLSGGLDQPQRVPVVGDAVGASAGDFLAVLAELDFVAGPDPCPVEDVFVGCHGRFFCGWRMVAGFVFCAAACGGSGGDRGSAPVEVPGSPIGLATTPWPVEGWMRGKPHVWSVERRVGYGTGTDPGTVPDLPALHYGDGKPVRSGRPSLNVPPGVGMG